MRTRPPKFKRHPTPSEVYAELSGLLVGAGCKPLPPVAITPTLRPRWSDGVLNLNVSADVPTLETM